MELEHDTDAQVFAGHLSEAWPGFGFLARRDEQGRCWLEVYHAGGEAEPRLRDLLGPTRSWRGMAKVADARMTWLMLGSALEH